MTTMRKVWAAVETLSSLLGLVLLFGPQTWREANLRAVFAVLLIVVLFMGTFGVVALWPQFQAPRKWGSGDE